MWKNKWAYMAKLSIIKAKDFSSSNPYSQCNAHRNPGVLCWSVGVGLDRLINNFKWKKNRPKSSQDNFEGRKIRRRFALPNIKFYFKTSIMIKSLD